MPLVPFFILRAWDVRFLRSMHVLGESLLYVQNEVREYLHGIGSLPD